MKVNMKLFSDRSPSMKQSVVLDGTVHVCCSGLERLQQLLDALTDAGDVLVQHVFRVEDAEDAFQKLRRLSRYDATTKHILVDLPTNECDDLLNKQVTECYLVTIVIKFC